jgi:hypothetical protein
MAINATIEQRNQQLAKDLANKLALERRLITALKSIFKDIGAVYEAELSRTNTVINVNEFRTDINAALKAQYRRANNKFGHQLRTQLRKEKGLNDDITIEQNEFINTESALKTGLILGTLQRQLDVIHTGAREIVVADDPFAFFATQSANDKVARIAGDKFESLIPGKSELISITETQNASESVKFIESSLLVAEGIITAEKIWMAILDEVTRLGHAIADGQTQPVTSAYSVNGERLNHPGDTSLGASAGNVVRCRCSSMTIVR